MTGIVPDSGLALSGPDLVFTNNLIIEVPDVIPGKYCAEIIESFEKNMDLQKHTLINTQYGHMDFMEAKLQEIGWATYFIEIMKPYIQKYIELTGLPNYCFPLEYGFESPRIKQYAPKTGVFEHHVDVGNYASARRFLVMMVYLNDVAVGGETDFPYHGIKVKPQTGKLVMFPSGFTHPHAGLSPISGVKLIASTYLHYL
jgi:hypothetical protein